MNDRNEFGKLRDEAIKNDPELREVERERLRRWREDHLEQERARQRAKYQANKEYYNQKSQAWYAANKDKFKGYAAKKRIEHGERERLRDREYYAKNQAEFAEKQKKRRNGPDRPKVLKLLRYAQHKHYLTRERYDEIYPRLAEGPCEICGRVAPMKIDHCHERNVFRGLLCDQCNRGIGYLQDDPEILRSAIAYLEKH